MIVFYTLFPSFGFLYASSLFSSDQLGMHYYELALYYYHVSCYCTTNLSRCGPGFMTPCDIFFSFVSGWIWKNGRTCFLKSRETGYFG